MSSEIKTTFIGALYHSISYILTLSVTPELARSIFLSEIFIQLPPIIMPFCVPGTAWAKAKLEEKGMDRLKGEDIVSGKMY